MRKDGKYRFTLQFSANSEEQIRVGELLEKLGNRKSTIIVSALSDYIALKRLRSRLMEGGDDE